MSSIFDFLIESCNWVEDTKSVVYEMAKTARYLADDIQHNRGTPIVIVDFSELHRYLYPTKRGQYKKRFGIWRDPNKHERVIDIFFDYSKYRKVLIPEYFKEFRNHLNTTIDIPMIDPTIDGCAGEPIDTKKIDVRIKERFKLLAEISSSNKEYQGKREEILNILREIQNDLFRLVHVQSSLQIHMAALKIFDELRLKGALWTLQRIKDRYIPNQDFKISHFDQTFASIYDFFGDLRPLETSKNKTDAMAVTTQIKLQGMINRRKRSVVLFSDSTIMHELVKYAEDVLTEKESRDNLRIHGTTYLAHAFSWLGRSGISKVDDVEKNLQYFRSWSRIGEQFSNIQSHLSLLQREVDREPNIIEKGSVKYNKDIEKARKYFDDINKQINLLEQEGILEAEIETVSKHMRRKLAEKSLDGRFEKDVRDMLDTLEAVKRYVKRGEKQMEANKYFDLSDKIAKLIRKVEGQFENLAREIQTIQRDLDPPSDF